MKYRILKDLPFIKQGDVFKKGCWGSGWGVDTGDAVITFENFEDKLLDSISIRSDKK